jgi:hypothetical protein
LSGSHFKPPPQVVVDDWEPKIKIDEGLKKTIAYFEKQIQ